MGCSRRCFHTLINVELAKSFWPFKALVID